MGMERTLGLGSELIEQVWERMNPNELPLLRQGPRERVLVIKGSYDSVEKILANAKIPHTALNMFPERKELYQGGRFQNSKIMFVNCDQAYHDNPEIKNLSSTNKSAMIDFVARGGRLITSDWAQVVVKYLFGKIRAKRDVTEDEVVQTQFSSDLGRMLSGITYGNAQPKWWLESCSDIIHYNNDSGIVELIESEEMRQKYGSKHVAIAFPHQKGEVFHFVSHLIAQKLANYDARDRECLRTFLDLTKTHLRDSKSRVSKLTFGEIETAYTLMNTVLELTRERSILNKLKGGGS